MMRSPARSRKRGVSCRRARSFCRAAENWRLTACVVKPIVRASRRGSMRVTTVHVAMIAVLAGCAAAVPQVPSQGGPAWRELTSEHFTVWSDADPGRARELVREMEHLRQVIVGVAFPGVPAGGRSLV